MQEVVCFCVSTPELKPSQGEPQAGLFTSHLPSVTACRMPMASLLDEYEQGSHGRLSQRAYSLADTVAYEASNSSQV